VLVGDASLSDAVQRTDQGILLLAAGSQPPNPAELLEGQRTQEVIAALRQRFDIVLIDSTPVLPVTDAALVSKLVDATIVVVDARSTRRSSLADTLEILDQAGAPIMGAVLNRMPLRDNYGYNTKRSRTYVSDPLAPKQPQGSAASTTVSSELVVGLGEGIDE
jgi:capsular exopolysaccharide synthesis family protein